MSVVSMEQNADCLLRALAFFDGYGGKALRLQFANFMGEVAANHPGFEDQWLLVACELRANQRGGCMAIIACSLLKTSMSSLRVFIHCAPECIPLFMDELTSENDNRTISEVLADKMSSKDIAKLLRDFPEAAASILQSVTSKPKVISEGWHPLPSRVSFASRSRLVRALSPFLRVGRFYTRYESEKEWSYDDEKYKEPEWHKKITQCEEPPIFDAMIQVCCIPNIISPNFFSAVLDASERQQPDALFLFKCVPIRAAVSYTFWNGAIWVDVAQFLVSVWGLGLLLVETFLAHEAAKDSQMLESNISRVFEPSFITHVYKRGVVADWIIAKGIVDLLLEVTQFWGTLAYYPIFPREAGFGCPLICTLGGDVLLQILFFLDALQC
eukprot:s4734_g1.t1